MTETVPPICTAALAADWDLVEGLLTSGADVTQKGPDGKSLLQLLRETEAITEKKMLKIAVSILIAAMRQIKNKEDLVRYVCEKHNGSTILGKMCEPRLATDECIINMIDICPLSEFLNETDSSGHTPLIQMCYQKRPVVAMKLLSIEGIELNTITSDTGDTALHWACWHQLVEVAHKLIDLGANIHIVSTIHINTPLKCAVVDANSDLSLILRLIHLETNHDQEDKCGIAVLDMLIKYRLEQCAIELVRMGYVNLNRVDFDDMTYLAFACKYGLSGLAKAILDTGRGKPWHVCVMSECYRPIAIYFAERNCKEFLPELIEKIASLGYSY